MTTDNLGQVRTFDLAERSLVCWVPNNVNRETPILIAHDAQNYLIPKTETWNGRNWGVLEAIESGALKPDANGKLPLIASVHLTDIAFRINELAAEDFLQSHPNAWSQLDPAIMPPSKLLTGNAYADAVALDVLPALCEKFGIEHSIERTAISGSSMGGVASLYAIGRHPQTYGTALAYSTHFPFGGDELVDYLIDALPVDGEHRFYIDAGTLDVDAQYAPFLERATKRMLARGLARDKEFVTRIVDGTGHNETWWSQRFAEVTNWWLKG